MLTKNWVVYIIECSDGSYYTGMTNNLERRLQQHANGKGAKYTKYRRPIQLRFTVTCPSRSEALKEEARIKKLSRKQKEAYFIKMTE